MRTDYVKTNGCDSSLAQIGAAQTETRISIREMFERLAEREADMVREGRRRAGFTDALQERSVLNVASP